MTFISNNLLPNSFFESDFGDTAFHPSTEDTGNFWNPVSTHFETSDFEPLSATAVLGTTAYAAKDFIVPGTSLYTELAAPALRLGAKLLSHVPVVAGGIVVAAGAYKLYDFLSNTGSSTSKFSEGPKLPNSHETVQTYGNDITILGTPASNQSAEILTSPIQNLKLPNSYISPKFEIDGPIIHAGPAPGNTNFAITSYLNKSIHDWPVIDRSEIGELLTTQAVAQDQNLDTYPFGKRYISVSSIPTSGRGGTDKPLISQAQNIDGMSKLLGHYILPTNGFIKVQSADDLDESGKPNEYPGLIIGNDYLSSITGVNGSEVLTPGLISSSSLITNRSWDELTDIAQRLQYQKIIPKNEPTIIVQPGGAIKLEIYKVIKNPSPDQHKELQNYLKDLSFKMVNRLDELGKYKIIYDDIIE